MMHSYYVYGLNVQSDIPLPELPPARGEPDVRIRQERLQEPWQPRQRGKRSFRETEGGVLLSWSEFARFLVRGGSEILVEPAPEGSRDASVIRHLILGPVFSVLNHQRGSAVFHASAVLHQQAGLAFMAGLGYGKSTQAAAFTRRGARLITDDLLILKFQEKQAWASPGVPFLKLWPPTLDMLGEEPSALPRVKDDIEKRTLTARIDFVQEPVRLRAIFLLAEGSTLEVSRLSPKEAFFNLIPNWYGSLFHGELLPIFGMQRQFMDCSSAVESLPVYRVQRPADMGLLPEVCQAIECSL